MTVIESQTLRRMAESLLESSIDTVQSIEEGIEQTALVTTHSGNYVIKAHKTDVYDSPEGFIGGPILMQILTERTEIPVPTVHGFRTKEESAFDMPYYVMEYVEGEKFDFDTHNTDTHEAVIAQSGELLARLHNLDVEPDGFGWAGYCNGTLKTFGEYSTFQSFLEEKLTERVVDLLNGGKFPEKAKDPKRFVDIAEQLDGEMSSLINTVSLDTESAYCCWDYRYQNFKIDPEEEQPITGVFDWDIPMVTDPIYNVRRVEQTLVDMLDYSTDISNTERVRLKQTLREPYQNHRDTQVNFNEYEERIALYDLYLAVEYMRNFGLFFEGATQTTRDKAEEHYRRKLTNSLEQLVD